MNKNQILKAAGEYADKYEKENGFTTHPKTASFHGYIAGYDDAKLATDGREQKPTLSDKIDSEDDDIYDRIIPPGIGKGDGVEQMFFNDGYYAGYKFGREELEKEFLKQKIGIEDFAKEQIQFKDDQITALQSSLKEKEKECEELKLAYEWAEKDKEEFRNILAENSNQIEELKAENERLKKELDLIFDKDKP